MNKSLQNLGFDSFFEVRCKELNIELTSVARVIAEYKNIYHVKNLEGEFSAKVTGKQMFEAASREDYPAVGDWVEIGCIENNQSIIKRVIPRKTVIKKTVVSRKSTGKVKNQIIAANVDTAFIVESVDRDYSLNRFERYFTLAQDAKIESSIILNKVDLISKDDLNDKVAEIEERFSNCTVVTTSTTNKEGLDNLRDSLEAGKTYCFLGSSGVGKSSLVNALIGEKVAKTGAISEITERGKHVTTHREMFFLNNGSIVIDNPGMREIGSVDSDANAKSSFTQIADLAAGCQFTNCSHVHEPGCAVIEAVQSRTFCQESYDNFIRTRKEVGHREIAEHEKRENERKFGKSVKRYHQQMKEFEEL